MKKNILILILSIISLSANAQIITPIKWEYKIEKVSSNNYHLKAIAKIDKAWHLYGQYFEDGGPIRMKFEFIKNKNVILIDSVLENPKPTIERDEIFDIDVQYFSNKAIFLQKVKVNKSAEINLIIDGQACNDKTGMCVMVNTKHTFILK